MTYDRIYISPHYETVPLSCGGRILQEKSKTLVVVVFGKTQNKITISDNIQALTKLNCDYMNLNFEESIIKVGKFQTACSIIFNSRQDVQNFPDVYIKLSKVLTKYSNNDTKIIFPLDIGNHPDHIKCFNIGKRLLEKSFFENIEFYENMPYTLCGDKLRNSFTKDSKMYGGNLENFSPLISLVDVENFRQKIDTVLIFNTKLNELFGTKNKPIIAKKFLDYSYNLINTKIGYSERYWKI
jgi:hypothetical protein